MTINWNILHCQFEWEKTFESIWQESAVFYWTIQLQLLRKNCPGKSMRNVLSRTKMLHFADKKISSPLALPPAHNSNKILINNESCCPLWTAWTSCTGLLLTSLWSPVLEPGGGNKKVKYKHLHYRGLSPHIIVIVSFRLFMLLLFDQFKLHLAGSREGICRE